MKTLLLALPFMMTGWQALANDTAIAGLKVNEIRMREYKYVDGEEKEVRRILKPQYKITFSGGEAEKLALILPSKEESFVGNQPDIKDQYAKSFKTLGIYNEKSDVTAKVLTIGCESADISFNDEGKATLTPKTTQCSIEILPVDDDGDPKDYINGFPFAPTCHN